MSTTTCPACGHTWSPTDPVDTGAPDPSVVRWFRTDAGWSGEAATDEIYSSYLRATDGAPVSRRRFVADLAHLGVEEVLDDETAMLLRH